MNTSPTTDAHTSQQPFLSFAGFPCRLHHGHYVAGNATALQLWDVANGELVTTATINIPRLALEPDEVVLKTWAENEGLLNILLDADIIHPPHEQYPVGSQIVVIARLKLPPQP